MFALQDDEEPRALCWMSFIWIAGLDLQHPWLQHHICVHSFLFILVSICGLQAVTVHAVHLTMGLEWIRVKATHSTLVLLCLIVQRA